MTESAVDFARRLQQRGERLADLRPQPASAGRLVRMVGMTLEAVGLSVAVGSRCLVTCRGGRQVEAEVVGFSEQRIFLMPTEKFDGLQPGARVVPLQRSSRVPVGMGLLGRVIDGAGRPLDSKGPLACTESIELEGPVINPLMRKPIGEVLDVGIRAH